MGLRSASSSFQAASGPLLRASWEDGILAVMGSQALKTTTIAVPQVLVAPGPVPATSNRADVRATVHRRRTQLAR